jgi:hypothetical protein
MESPRGSVLTPRKGTGTRFLDKEPLHSFNSVFDMMSDIMFIVPIIIHPNRSSPTNPPTPNLKKCLKAFTHYSLPRPIKRVDSDQLGV